ncbi:MAG: T9SS type A sorting domain-containing protein [Sphingobacteriaceae bacterium]|nr:T9SS type A sorting domain-containing protein [Sphingobacteriaceae bacterium]
MNSGRIKSISFTNSIGQEIFLIKNVEMGKKINLSSLPSGLYFVNIQTPHEMIVRKIIKD